MNICLCVEFHSFFHTSTISLKYGCSLFTTWIDELEQIVGKSIKQDVIGEVTILKAIIMLLVYTNKVVLPANTLEYF